MIPGILNEAYGTLVPSLRMSAETKAGGATPSRGCPVNSRGKPGSASFKVKSTI
jgi:hypothetical protein